jgi:tetratricopeptide (TPR) repeat protein
MSRSLLICLLLIAATAAVYGQVIRFDFVSWDDPIYVTENVHVRRGLTTDGLVWAFTTAHGGNWHPLTGLSHMLDCQLYGVNPVGHHLTNIVLHILNALLLFGVLRVMTRAVFPSAFVAALFALHPLHVESVAWVSERKDVLSTLLGLLSMWAYVAYARRAGLGRYLLTALFLALGLMAKPMLVTLPLVFLLLDYWPLDRLRVGPEVGADDREATESSTAPRLAYPRRSIGHLLLEKIPLAALSAISSAVTFTVQRSQGSMQPADVVPIQLRVANALVSYVWYIGKTIWPSSLSVLYPHPNLAGGTPWAAWQVAGAAVLLLVISVLMIRVTRRRYAIVGWLWYLGTLVPVIGLVQVGYQAAADRYTYVPLIGLFIIAAWGGADLVASWQRRHPLVRPAMALAAAVVVAAAMACTWSQARYWRDAVTLYEHALEVAPRHPLMHNNLGFVLRSQGKLDRAIRHYRQALEVDPNFALAHNNLGNALHSQGKLDEAIRHYRRALQADPDLALAHNNMGYALQSRGKLDEAIRHYRRALQADPDLALAHNNLGFALRSQGMLDEAIRHYRRALQADPDFALAHNNLGFVLQSQGMLDEAIRHYRHALRVEPNFTLAHNNLGYALRSQGMLDEAVKHFREADSAVAERETVGRHLLP